MVVVDVTQRRLRQRTPYPTLVGLQVVVGLPFLLTPRTPTTLTRVVCGRPVSVSVTLSQIW